jgi:hypothetical protein
MTPGLSESVRICVVDHSLHLHLLFSEHFWSTKSQKASSTAPPIHEFSFIQRYSGHYVGQRLIVMSRRSNHALLAPIIADLGSESRLGLLAKMFLLISSLAGCCLMFHGSLVALIILSPSPAIWNHVLLLIPPSHFRIGLLHV